MPSGRPGIVVYAKVDPRQRQLPVSGGIFYPRQQDAGPAADIDDLARQRRGNNLIDTGFRMA